jgi:uncharacterized protein (TIGR00251 family)
MAFRFSVRVKPGASRTKVGGCHGQPPALIVAVHEQPVDGQANDAVITAVARVLEVRKSDLSIVSGHTNRTKVVECEVDEVSEKVLKLMAE